MGRAETGARCPSDGVEEVMGCFLELAKLVTFL